MLPPRKKQNHLFAGGGQFARARHLELSVVYPKLSRAAEETIEIRIDDCEDSGNSIIQTTKETLKDIGEKFEISQYQHGETEVRCTYNPRFTCTQGLDLYQMVQSEIKAADGELLVLGKHDKLRGEEAEFSLVRMLFKHAPCDTLLIRLGESKGENCKNILVPAAGGPHSLVALKWSEQIAMENNGQLTALHIEPDMGNEAEDVGQYRLRNILNCAEVELTSWVKTKVIVADNVPQGIGSAAQEGYDLLIVGASDRGFIRKILFGSVRDHLFAGPNAIAVGALRRSRPWTTRFRASLEGWLDLRVPQMDRETRIALVDHLQTGSRWNFDFMAMMGLATTIAAFGLIQSSTAVVIGAMLVAPLMMPLIASGLALVQGNVPLIRESIQSIMYGFLLALGIGFSCGLLSPLRQLTSEMAARGNPNLFDLGVAFVSGMAAAYAMSRPKLSASLPGVAIAAALVPPLATTGIALGFGEPSVARGAAMLFATNVVAIILGASVIFYACGVRGNQGRGQPRLWVRRSILGLVLATIVLAIPLASVIVARISEHEIPKLNVSTELWEKVQTHVEVIPENRFLRIAPARIGKEWVLDITIESSRPPSAQFVADLANYISDSLERQVRIRVHTQLVNEGRGVMSTREK